ncbi:restriction endonuclease [Streptomyces sp. WAC 06738]|uniref:Uma2 family endonuclease n=1 Tax=Streptomyces sp. WAC 06738 TaxID=2203210 RepID=UPI000F6DE1A4|nr:Uma2 family endonuclease [Streptomyces sp. WAC 06738]AZM46794.1 restriction endonuclease [Streptomyces sp. WAC 06738]
MSMPPKKPEHTTPAWPMPPSGGYTADDLDTLPDLPPHTELIDGSLVFRTPQSIFHSETVGLLQNGLRRTVPDDLAVLREMTVVISEQQRPEPDLVVVRRDAATTLAQTSFQAQDVLLAVEVVSPESVDRDRETKPLKYAKAGIQHFWRVERKREQAVVHVYQLDDATRNYMLTGIHTDRLKLSLPYEIDIDLTLSY